MEYSAKGLRVVVTAGAAGIGRAIARTFVEHGARVHICDVDQRALKEAGSSLPGVTQTLADVANVDDVERLFRDAKQNLGGLDVLLNNAGIAGPTAKVEDIRPEDWDRCIAVERIVAAKAEQLGVDPSEILARMVEGIILKTTVTAQDIANTALFLASEHGRHISGQSISVCGGARYLV